MTPAVDNALVARPDGVWQLKGHERFGYSDGLASERYLEEVLRGASDLSAGSPELEGHIKDWPSEYHLSRKRQQLLSPFTFDRSARVLEVGCGCGAITRILAERFDSVTSVEGNLNRARIARLRTRDLDSVSVICAPFQEIRFRERFDVIFCIGVYEYSGSFVDDANPYEAVLDYFSDMLTPNGQLVIAIENQFGLKYLAGYNEDHLAVPFEGVEGYHRRPVTVRTFGRKELAARLSQRFDRVDFYFPYPDYKMPDAVIAADFVDSGEASEIVSQIHSRDYAASVSPVFQEGLAAFELGANGLLGDLANSFIAVAGRGAANAVRFEQRAELFSPARRAAFATKTRIPEGSGEVAKQLLSGAPFHREGPVTLRETRDPWIDGLSMQSEILREAAGRQTSLAEAVAPARMWVEHLAGIARREGGRSLLPPDYLDAIWGNSYRVDGGCRIIDREWLWSEDIELEVVAIRAIYDLVAKTEALGSGAILSHASGRKLIEEAAAAIGLTVVDRHVQAFVAVECAIAQHVHGIDPVRQRRYLETFLRDRRLLRLATAATRTGRVAKRRVRSGVGRIAARLGR